MTLIEQLNENPLIQINSEVLSTEMLADKAVLFVNVASYCGYTRQYTGLVSLQQSIEGLQIIGVPCNQFGQQEPASAAEILEFCQVNYDLNFPLLVKQEVNGADRSPLYEWLISSAAQQGLDRQDIAWNFEKFLVGRDGQLLKRFSSRVSPSSPELRDAISEALAR